MSKDDELELCALASPFYLIATLFVLLTLNSWGRWLLGNSEFIPSYYTDRFSDAAECLLYYASRASLIEITSILIASIMYAGFTVFYVGFLNKGE